MRNVLSVLLWALDISIKIKEIRRFTLFHLINFQYARPQTGGGPDNESVTEFWKDPSGTTGYNAVPLSKDIDEHIAVEMVKKQSFESAGPTKVTTRLLG